MSQVSLFNGDTEVTRSKSQQHKRSRYTYTSTSSKHTKSIFQITLPEAKDTQMRKTPSTWVKHNFSQWILQEQKQIFQSSVTQAFKEIINPFNKFEIFEALQILKTSKQRMALVDKVIQQREENLKQEFDQKIKYMKPLLTRIQYKFQKCLRNSQQDEGYFNRYALSPAPQSQQKIKIKCSASNFSQASSQAQRLKNNLSLYRDIDSSNKDVDSPFREVDSPYRDDSPHKSEKFLRTQYAPQASLYTQSKIDISQEMGRQETHLKTSMSKIQFDQPATKLHYLHSDIDKRFRTKFKSPEVKQDKRLTQMNSIMLKQFQTQPNFARQVLCNNSLHDNRFIRSNIKIRQKGQNNTISLTPQQNDICSKLKDEVETLISRKMSMIGSSFPEQQLSSKNITFKKANSSLHASGILIHAKGESQTQLKKKQKHKNFYYNQ